ncbi:MAG: hypothetical protein P1U56_21560 [Saprospiraceae bacterium]|nr:hypothetical protein [Saprospiraceae bacterium]
MSKIRFFQLLFLTVALLAGILYFMSLNEKIYEHIDIAYYAIPAFTLLSVLIYFLTEHLDKQQNKGMMINLVIMNVMFKFLIAIGIVSMYHKLRDPKDGIFVLTFIIIYVIFTIFETYFMSVQAKSK